MFMVEVQAIQPHHLYFCLIMVFRLWREVSSQRPIGKTSTKEVAMNEKVRENVTKLYNVPSAEYLHTLPM